MLELGKQQVRTARIRVPGTFKFIPKLDVNGQPVEQLVASEVWRRTKHRLDGSFSRHAGYKLVVGLLAGDVITIYPSMPWGKRTASITLKLSQVYRYGVHCKANLAVLEKARAAKERKATARAERRGNRPLHA